jgi:two-component system, OmpR family, response regulator
MLVSLWVEALLEQAEVQPVARGFDTGALTGAMQSDVAQRVRVELGERVLVDAPLPRFLDCEKDLLQKIFHASRLGPVRNRGMSARKQFVSRLYTFRMATRLLVVDDDPAIREMLSEYLSNHGYEVALADGGAAMRAELERAKPALVLLDVGLPGEDGLTLARYVRERYDVGIIMVTGADDVVDRVAGLEVGADDYVAKPFDPRELRARVKSVLRRLESKGSERMTAAAEVVLIGACQLNLRSRQLSDAKGREVPLTAMEFELLKTFLDHPNQVLSRDRLLTLTRNREWEPFDRSIDIRIARLRRKVEDDPDRPRAIRTVRGAGYMYVPGDK